MTRAELKSRLKLYTAYKKEMYHIMDELNDIHSMIDNIQAQRLTGMPTATGKRPSVQESMIEKIMKVQDSWIKRVDEMGDMLKRTEKFIMMFEDSTLRDLLRYKYIDGKTWEEIAYKMEYCWQYMHTLHNKALDLAIEYEYINVL